MYRPIVRVMLATLFPLGPLPAQVPGQEIYNRSCTACHGLNATAGDRAPALAAERQYLRISEQDLFDAIRKGIPGTQMPPSTLPDEDIRKIATYIRSLRATASDTPVAGDVAHGETVFLTKGCSGCHTIGGKGGFLGPDLSNVAAERSLAFLRNVLSEARPNTVRGYRAARLVTADGKRLTGIIKNENNFSLQFLDRDGELHLLARDELKQVTYDRQSAMPGEYSRTLTSKEMQDLLAFLSRRVRDQESK